MLKPKGPPTSSTDVPLKQKIVLLRVRPKLGILSGGFMAVWCLTTGLRVKHLPRKVGNSEWLGFGANTRILVFLPKYFWLICVNRVSGWLYSQNSTNEIYIYLLLSQHCFSSHHWLEMLSVHSPSRAQGACTDGRARPCPWGAQSGTWAQTQASAETGGGPLWVPPRGREA